MSHHRQLAKSRSAKQLLKTLTDNPALPAFIQTMATPVLHRLIEHVGLRDSGDLIALTTTEQMRDIFEVSLWETPIPGEAETLRPERFIEWLDVMLEVGNTFTAERLMELGETFVALHLAAFITVIDRTVAAEHQEEACMCVFCTLVGRDASFEVVGEYIVVGIHQDEWSTIQAVLLELESEDADFLNRVLVRCSTAPTMHDFTGDVHAETLVSDETYDREQRRSRSGFVTPPLAASFLDNAKRSSLDALASRSDYDDFSQRYFDRLAKVEPSGQSTRTPGEEPEDDTPPITPLQRRELETALIEAEIVSAEQPQLLPAPEARQISLELQARLERLRLAHPDRFSERLAELVYLANILMAGSWFQGDRFSNSDAARAALACANLGLDHLLAEHADDAWQRTLTADDLLAAPPGIVRLFEIGWHLLQRVPKRCATGLIEALQSEHVREQLARKRWILDEIESAVSDPDILLLIDQGAFEDVGDNLVLLSLVLDVRACQCLSTLIVDFPRYPAQLDAGFHPSQPLVKEHRHFTEVRQLERVDVFIEELDRLLKV
jgi:hypothetical protein